MKKQIAVFLIAAALAAASVDISPVHAQTDGPAGGWSEFQHAGAAAQASTTRAARTGYKHVADCIVATFVAGATAADARTLVLRDGAAGSGTVVASWSLAAPVNSTASLALCGIGKEGTAGNAMTLEFTTAGAATTLQAVFLKGYDRR